MLGSNFANPLTILCQPLAFLPNMGFMYLPPLRFYFHTHLLKWCRNIKLFGLFGLFCFFLSIPGQIWLKFDTHENILDINTQIPCSVPSTQWKSCLVWLLWSILTIFCCFWSILRPVLVQI